MTTLFEQEKARLATLPRAERFEQLIQFPTSHSFIAIGRREGLQQILEQALESCGYQEVVFIERPSAKGNYLSLSFTLSVSSGVELDRIYCLLEQLPELAYLI